MTNRRSLCHGHTVHGNNAFSNYALKHTGDISFMTHRLVLPEVVRKWTPMPAAHECTDYQAKPRRRWCLSLGCCSSVSVQVAPAPPSRKHAGSSLWRPFRRTLRAEDISVKAGDAWPCILNSDGSGQAYSKQELIKYGYHRFPAAPPLRRGANYGAFTVHAGTVFSQHFTTTCCAK